MASVGARESVSILVATEYVLRQSTRRSSVPMAAAMDAQALRLQRSVLAAQLRRNRLETRRVQQAARTAAQAEELAWVLPGHVRHTAVIIYDLCRYNATPAARFLKAAGKKRRWPKLSDEALCLLVELTFTGMIEDVGATEVAALVSTTSPSDESAMRDALRWAEEGNLYLWSERQNVERGVTPSTSQLLTELAGARAAAGRPAPGTTAQAKVRKWGTLFRRRWRGRFGSLPTKDQVPLGVMRAKATNED